MQQKDSFPSEVVHISFPSYFMVSPGSQYGWGRQVLVVLSEFTAGHPGAPTGKVGSEACCLMSWGWLTRNIVTGSEIATIINIIPLNTFNLLLPIQI